jgi:hypothetical protein
VLPQADKGSQGLLGPFLGLLRRSPDGSHRVALLPKRKKKRKSNIKRKEERKEQKRSLLKRLLFL